MSDVLTGMAQALGNEGGFDGVADLDYSETGPGNVFIGHLPANPNRIVAVFPAAGLPADSALPYDSPAIQIIVRGDEDPRWALAMWWKIYSWVQGMRNVVLPDGTYLVSCLAIQSGPVHIGQDQSRRYQYGMNLQTETKNPTAQRPEPE